MENNSFKTDVLAVKASEDAEPEALLVNNGESIQPLAVQLYEALYDSVSKANELSQKAIKEILEYIVENSDHVKTYLLGLKQSVEKNFEYYTKEIFYQLPHYQELSQNLIEILQNLFQGPL